MSRFLRRDLLLAEEVLLLVLDDEKGTVDWRAGNYQLALGAALISELLLMNCVEIDDSKKHLVSCQSTDVQHPVLKEAVELVAQSEKQKPLQYWVTKFAQIKQLKQRLADELVQQRVLKKDEKDFLLFFTRTVFPERTGSVEDSIKKRVDEALYSDNEIEPRTGVLLSLLSTTGILNIYYGSKERKERKQRIKSIVDGSCIAKETGKVVESIQAAQAVAAIVPAIAATTVTTSY